MVIIIRIISFEKYFDELSSSWINIYTMLMMCICSQIPRQDSVSRRINTAFNRKPKNLHGVTPVHIQGVATVDEVEELKRITKTTSNQDLWRALINEKLYPQLTKKEEQVEA